MILPQELNAHEVKILKIEDFDCKEVFIYKNKAEVKRILNDVKLENSEKKIVITNLSSLIDPDSIR